MGHLGPTTWALVRAGEVGEGLAASKATTLKHLKLICEERGIDIGILDPIRNPSSITAGIECSPKV